MASTWRWQLLRAGAFRLDGGAMFGVVPKALWSRVAPADEQNRIALQTNCLLLEREGTRVLVETGYGGKWSEKDRAIFAMEPRTVVDALAEVGVAPSDIDHVVVTHLHFDHAAGLTALGEDGATPAPVFPRARIVVQRLEWDDACANKSTMTATYLKSHLTPIADRVRLVDGEAEVLPGIHVFPVPGHTWGQQAVRFDDGDGPVCFPGDVVPTRNHAGLAFNMAYDQLPYQNLLTKQDLFARARAEGWRLVLDHEPDAPVVRVIEDVARPGREALEVVDAAG